MALRHIVEIDEEKCNGCGQCIPNCKEGALQIVVGKAKLVSDAYCDGLGACLGTCPQGAIKVIEREAEAFDLAAAEAYHAVAGSANDGNGVGAKGAGACPALSMGAFGNGTGQASAAGRSHQWPVQLMLVPVNAPYLDGADLLLVADCVPFVMPDFHERMLPGKTLMIGCPKLDDTAYYADKLAEILRQNDVRSLTVAHMEVPCCSALVALARDAMVRSGRSLPFDEITVSVHGELASSSPLART